MKRLLIFIILIFAASAAIAAERPGGEPELRQPASKEWLHVGGDWSNSRYSTLTQITRDNVKTLKGAWVTHLGSGLGAKYSLETTPIVKDGVMYVTTGNDDVFALDAKSGALIWQHKSGIDQNISTVCCGWDNRGVAIGDGRVFLGQLDGRFVALDAKTGKLVWQTQIAKWQDGYTITSAPTYYRGVVYTGISGGDRSARGKLTALDAKTGKELWHFWTAAGPGERGGNTWPSPNDADPEKAHAFEHGGANIWQAPAIDPDLGLIYFSTGQPGPEAVGLGSKRPGDNLYSSSIVALHLDGSYAWHFQMVHHDLWDFDCPSPVVLFDQVYGGILRKGIAEACKTGWIYLLDRTNGTPLIGIDEKPVEQDRRVATSPTQPIPRGDALIPQCPQPLAGWTTKCIFGVIYDMPILMSPGGNGGTNWAPMAYSPQTGLFYVTAADRPQSRILRQLGKSVGPPVGAHYSGTLSAVDSRTNKIVWQKKLPYSVGQGSGALATASGLIFHGQPDGNFQAYDAKSGDLLWQWQTGAGADAPAITYEIDGQQYVAIAAGGVAIQTTSANSDMIWAFSLNGSPGGRLQPFDPPPPPQTVVAFDGAVEATNAVKLVDYAFAPQRITVAAGQMVTFTNTGTETHNASSSDSGGWDTGMLATGQSASVTFNRPGTYNFNCSPHPSMIGQVIVTGEAVTSAPAVVVRRSGPAPAAMHAH
ncbi:MAG TPA: PQQ-binding-like beta-propeller repeat protein [Micropepsaceae bacterium]|nr:PQQ-binding-like beta-propeller repeat protein [Micropepsaceae bacterium]